MRGFFKEFETFIVRGNAADLAFGVVIGAAVGQLTTSLASDILTPPLGLLFGGLDFSKMALPLGGSAVISYGLFLQALLNFVIIALALFLFVKLLNSLAKKRKQEDSSPKENPQLAVLMEIRDTLRHDATR